LGFFYLSQSTAIDTSGPMMFLLQKPETSLLWTAKDGKIPNKWLDKYEDFPGIKDDAEMLRKMPTEEIIDVIIVFVSD
jgi:hypothetical protein